MVVPRRFRARVARDRAVTLTRLILECLAELGATTLDAFFPAKYPEARIWRALLGLDQRYRFERKSFSSLLSRLRAEGLVARSGSKHESQWRLTAAGKEFLAEEGLAGARRPDGIRRVVAFDVPERERKKRDAIRAELISAGFSQLQKSVWIGDRPLPQDFLEFVGALGLRSCVHIFSVRESGTLV